MTRRYDNCRKMQFIKRQAKLFIKLYLTWLLIYTVRHLSGNDDEKWISLNIQGIYLSIYLTIVDRSDIL